MKRVICLMAIVIVTALVLCGCGDNAKSTDGGNNGQETAGTSDNQNGEVDISTYKKPAEAVRIDLTEADPSSDEMRFVYDDEGKVTQCYYNIGGQQVYVNYSYKDGSAQIYAFMGEILAADELIKISDFDAEKGFSSIEGYYFKGFSAE